MDWLKRFMMGRYGGDQLSMALLIFSVLLSVIAGLVRLPLLSVIGYVPLALCIFRMLSRNIQKRSMENYKFSMLVSPVYSWFKRTQRRLTESKTHKFINCPKCKAELRLPKGKGKIIITCPKCKNEFGAKS